MGRSIALTLARAGARVVVNYLTSTDSAQAIVKQVASEGGKAAVLRADIMQQDQCRTLVDFAAEEYGKIDICIIGPGAGWNPESVDQLNPAAALEDVGRELAPIYNLMPLVLPGMYEQKWGRVIAISLTPPYNTPAFSYNVAKAARTDALMLARDPAWQQGVTVNTIAPGPVVPLETLDIAAEQCAHGPAWQTRGTASPQDIAECVAFLCSESGNFISGAVIPFMFR